MGLLLLSTLPTPTSASETQTAPARSRAAASDHFTVSHARAEDQVLVPYLLDALSAERERLAAAGAALPDGTLEVEIVAAPEDLERRTSLDAKQIAAGAPAACEGGTLVLVSPRAAVGGYPWLDAAAREYRRCAAGGAAGGRPARVPVRWRGAPAPKPAAGGKAELVRDFARLGDILRARGRAVPARIEYDKAVRRGGLTDPEVVARYAETALATGSIGAAEEPLRQAAREHPRNARVQAVLGKVESQKGNWAGARDAYAAAIGVEPYDPDVHAGLAAALEELGDASGASRESRIAEMLRGGGT